MPMDNHDSKETERPAKNIGDISPLVLIATAFIPLVAVAWYFLSK